MALLLAAAASGQEQELWRQATIDELAPKLRRAAAMTTLREAADGEAPEADRELLEIAQMIDASLAEALWLDDGRLSPWGADFFEIERQIVARLTAGVRSGGWTAAQEEAAGRALSQMVAADLGVLERELEAGAETGYKLGCVDDPTRRNCAKNDKKLRDGDRQTAAALEAMGSDSPEVAVERIALGWKHALKSQRKYLASKSRQEAEAMAARLETAIDQTGCNADPVPKEIAEGCVAAQKRLDRVRYRLEVSATTSRAKRSDSFYWKAWKMSWTALWEDLPPGSGYPGSSP